METAAVEELSTCIDESTVQSPLKTDKQETSEIKVAFRNIIMVSLITHTLLSLIFSFAVGSIKTADVNAPLQTTPPSLNDSVSGKLRCLRERSNCAFM